MSLPCDVTSLQHPAALSTLIGRDVSVTESRDTGSAGEIGSPRQSGLVSGSSASAGSAGRSAWRCDVCGYSTTVARNLRIHMTSEKHTHNVAVLHRQQQHQSHQMRLQQQLNTAVAVLPTTSYHPAISSLPWSAAPPAAPFLPLPTPVDLTRPCHPRSTRATTVSQPGQHQQQSGQASTDGGSRVSGPVYACNLCPYRTTLRANFHLHCQTDKHTQRVQQFALTVAGGAGCAANVDVITRSLSHTDPLRCSVVDDNYDTNSVCGTKRGDDATLRRHVAASQGLTEQHSVDDLHPNDVSPSSTKTRLGGSDCRLCRHSCSDRASLQQHLVQVHRVKPQVLQFLLDLVEVQTDTAANSSACSSTFLEDGYLDDVTKHSHSAHRATNVVTSTGCDRLSAASDQRSERTTSKSDEDDRDSQESNPGDTGRCSVPRTRSIDKDLGLSGKESHVQTTPDDVRPCNLRDFTREMSTHANECSVTRSKRTEHTSPGTAECELKSTIYNRCSAETHTGLNSQQKECCRSDISVNFASECFSSCRCSVEFDNSAELQEHVCGLNVARDHPSPVDDCQTLEQVNSMFQSTCKKKTEQDGQDDVSAPEDAVGVNQVSEHSFSTLPLASDLTWNMLIGTESSNEYLLSKDTERSTKLQGDGCNLSEMPAGSTSVQPVINDHRICTVSSSSDSNGEVCNISPGGFSDFSVSQLSSNAWNALLLHIGLDCVNKLNRSLLLHADSECDFQMSKSDDDEGPRVRGVDDPRMTSSTDVRENLTHEDGQSEGERCLRLTCFYCLQRFDDAATLQTHFERTHCQSQSVGGAFHSRPDQHRESVINGSGVSGVSADSSAFASTISGQVTSATGIWDRLPDSASSSYFSGISPEILSLLSAVPPELMLPHVYAGGILPPAMMIMMLASPFVGCPTSPLPNSLAALADPHTGLLPSATDSHPTYDDAGMSSVHQQSRRARTRISDSQLAVLRTRFDINGPPNDDEIAAIASEVGLPSKVVKHWFRNTLFKERQRCKDSPYNFSVPPACDLPSASSSSAAAEKSTETSTAEVGAHSAGDDNDYERQDVRSDVSLLATDSSKLCSSSLPQHSTAQSVTAAAASEAPYFPRGCYFGMPYPPAPQSSVPLLPSVAPVPAANISGAQIVSVTSTSTGVSAHHPPPTTTTQSRGGHGKRASRTHFSDEQVRTLQEHFERNAYPRDDELESLSRRLGLSARVIVVWFQNARQKARRTYENHSSAGGGSGTLSGSSKTDDGVGGPRYDCRSCGAAFQRYYELIKHQRSHVGCGAIVPSTSTTKYSTQLPDNVTVTVARNDAAQLRYDKPPNTAATAAAATVASPSYRQHYNHRHHQPQQPRVEAWYRSPVDGYVGAVSPRGPEVVNQLPVQHALPAVFPPHLPLLTPWNSAPGCKEETFSGSTLSGVDMTSSRRQTDLVDKKCETQFVIDRTPSEESAINATPDQRDNGRQSVVRYDEDRKPLQKDAAARQSPEQPLNSWEETSYSSADSKRRGLAEATSSHLHHRTMVSPTAPSSAAMMFSGLSAEQHGRQLLGGGEMVATSLSSPRRSYDVQRRAASLDDTYFAPQFGLSTTSSEDESPLDLTCQGKTTSTWSSCDRSNESLRETAAAEELKPFAPTANAADGGSLSLSGTGTTAKSQQAGVSSKRYRTHMSDLQVRVMRAIYADHRTPSIGECATLGSKIGLARRVVQVWFQNARAKDKKRSLTEGALEDGSGLGDSDGGVVAGDGRCRWCGVTYSVERCSVREHVFSPEHVATVDRIVRASTDAERRGGATVGRASKRDHRRRLLHRSLASSSPIPVSSSSMSTTSSASSLNHGSVGLIACRHVTAAGAAAAVSAVTSDHHSSVSSSTSRLHPSSSSTSSEQAAVADDCSGDKIMASGANMFSPYAVKYPHTNTGVLPFLFPGYGGLLPPGFATHHLPITGGNGLNYVGGCDPVSYGLPRPLLTAGTEVTCSGGTAPWNSQT